MPSARMVRTSAASAINAAPDEACFPMLHVNSPGPLGEQPINLQLSSRLPPDAIDVDDDRLRTFLVPEIRSDPVRRPISVADVAMQVDDRRLAVAVWAAGVDDWQCIARAGGHAGDRHGGPPIARGAADQIARHADRPSVAAVPVEPDTRNDRQPLRSVISA